MRQLATGLIVFSLTLGLATTGVQKSEAQGMNPKTETFGEETVTNIGSGKNVELDGTTVTGSVMTGQSIQGTRCTTGDLIASHDVRLNNCKTGRVMASGQVFLHHTTVNGTVTASRGLEMHNSEVSGTVAARKDVNLRNSRIEGKLIFSGNELELHGSELGALELKKVGSSGQQVVISSGSVSHTPSGKTLLTVQQNGTATFNGYHVSAEADSTRVETPEGFVFVNGEKAGQKGPATYAQYQQAHPQAPVIEGPGWTPGEAGEYTAGPSEPEAPSQRVDLFHTTVLGNVIFDGGNGVVHLHGDSEVQGQIVGGRLAK